MAQRLSFVQRRSVGAHLTWYFRSGRSGNGSPTLPSLTSNTACLSIVHLW